MRAKFVCTSVTNFGEHCGVEVKLDASYSDNNVEDNQFSQATPSGNLTMHVDNPEAKEFFKPGKQFYMDFTEVK